MTHAKDIVQNVDGEQQAQQHVVERQQLDAMYLAGTSGGISRSVSGLTHGGG